MRPLEPLDAPVVTAEHERARREELEILRFERLVVVCPREKVVRLGPGASRVGLTTPLELVDPVRRTAPHCPPNLSAGRGPSYCALFAACTSLSSAARTFPTCWLMIGCRTR